MKTALLSLAVVAVAGVPGVASASTVSVDGSGTVVYQAAPGEANKLDLASPFGPLGFADTGATLSAGLGCAADGLITCPAGAISVTLGDRADAARVNSFAPTGDVSVDGGSGADDLFVGGNRDATGLGGSGDDIIVMVANGGATASGGPGNDGLAGLSNSDSLDGDGGADLLAERPGPTPATLSGGDGNDRLVGSDSDRLFGGNGTDLLVGGGFAGVTLDGGNGTDLITSTGGATITAGSGADLVSAADDSGVSDTISCGPGYDVVWADATDRVSRDCERRIPGPAPALPGTTAAIAAAQALLAHRPNVT